MDQLIGKMLDNRYEILDVIGVGGMSMVYKAYCHRLHRFVAIKVLKKDLAADDEFRRRFHEEAQAVAMLSHPNIVAVYDVSKGDDLDYIVMELIDGITLKQYMQKKNGCLNWREALYFTNQIVQALGHAHGRGIIHRDIKPQNILVLRDGSVKVADFGIARILSNSQSSTLTQEALGSVHYISPEQARGSHIDARSDLYSAGVVLYEMLTGRLPFDGDTPVSVALQHINSTPLSPRELNPDIPAGMEEITMKAMAPRIDLRYLNAEAMLEDLEEIRKDPEMTFHYNLASFRSSQPEPDEPTQKVASPDIQTKHQRGRVKVPVIGGGRNYDEYDDDEYEEEEGHRRILVPIIVVVCLVAAAVGLWLAFFSGLFDKTEMAEVPYLLGRTLTEVYEDPAVIDNFQVNRVSTEFSDEYDEGEIISQDPSAGVSVEKGTTINVVVSGGQEYIEMVDVTDMNVEKATSQLEGLGLVVEEPEYEYSEDVAEGNVISSSPEAGSPILPGDSVHLVVSLGEEIKTVRVPSVTGSTLESARVTLTSQGLSIAGVTEVTNDRPQGQVIYQSIPAGTEVEEGTSLTLQVSKGPEKEEPVIPKVTVPTVTGQPLDVARTMLSGVDLRIANVAEVDSDAPAGQVVYQSIPAGTSVDEGSSISLQVSKGPAQPPEEEPEEPEL